MKLQIDTTAKIIRIDETVKINELVKVLEKLLPNEWQDYSLETNCIINWGNPIIVEKPYYPWPLPITVHHNTGTPLPKNPYEVTCGVYNLELS